MMDMRVEKRKGYGKQSVERRNGGGEKKWGGREGRLRAERGREREREGDEGLINGLGL